MINYTQLALKYIPFNENEILFKNEYEKIGRVSESMTIPDVSDESMTNALSRSVMQNITTWKHTRYYPPVIQKQNLFKIIYVLYGECTLILVSIQRWGTLKKGMQK